MKITACKTVDDYAYESEKSAFKKHSLYALNNN